VLALQLVLGSAGFGRDTLFYSLVFLHALAALAGFGSIGFAGTYAAGAYLPWDRPQDLASQPVDGTVQLEPSELAQAEVVPAESGPAVPDYETALLQYHAALREFETSDLEDEPSEPIGQVPGKVGEAELAPAQGAAGDAQEISSRVVPDVVEEVVAAEVVVQAVPATTSEAREAAAELDAEAEEMRRYFAHPARLWGCLILVPFLGAGALAAQPSGKGLDQPWVFGALAVWLAATLIAGSLVVPSLHQMQAVLLKSDNAGTSPAARSSLSVRFARAGRIASRSAAFCDVLFLVALGLMIFRP
jgi:hypothetical protein